MASKSKSTEALAAEELLKYCLEIAEALGGYLALAKHILAMLGRVGLKLTNEELSGRERTSYTVVELRALFLKDVSADMGRPIAFEKWDAPDGKTQDAQSALNPEQKARLKGTATLRDHSDAAWIAAQQGFEVGKMVIEKQVELSPERLYTIFIIQDNVVTLHQAIRYTNSPIKVGSSLAEMIENWGVSKSEPPISMMEAPALPASISIELRKPEVLKAILALHDKLSKKATPLAFYWRPDEVRTTTHVKSGTMALTPLCSVGQISTRNTSSNASVSLWDAQRCGAIRSPNGQAKHRQR
mgnify:CR=1 FL=1